MGNLGSEESQDPLDSPASKEREDPLVSQAHQGKLDHGESQELWVNRDLGEKQGSLEDKENLVSYNYLSINKNAHFGEIFVFRHTTAICILNQSKSPITTRYCSPSLQCLNFYHHVVCISQLCPLY